LAEICLVDTVNRGEDNILGLKGRGGFLIMRGKGLAVSTPEDYHRSDMMPKGFSRRSCLPGRKKLDEHEAVAAHFLLVRVAGELEDIRVREDKGCQCKDAGRPTER
jgi:hypothetical protein